MWAHYRSAFKTFWLPPRSSQQEWLDAEDLAGPDLGENLQDLRWLNRYLGSHWIARTAVHRLWRAAGSPRQWSLLDVGTGVGDIPEVVLRWGQQHGVEVSSVALDNHRGVLQCRQTSPSQTLPIAFVQGDGLCLPFQPRTFDVVVCSTMLHHLEWHEGIILLREMARLARHGIVVNDLVRGRVHYLAARLFLPLVTRNRLTRHDGPLSVLRAYSVDEVRTMAGLAGLAQVRVRMMCGYRLLLMATMPGAAPKASDGS